MKRYSVLVLLLALVLITCTACSSSKNIYENKEHHYRVDFPDNWKIEKEKPRGKIIRAIAPNAAAEIVIRAFPVSKESQEFTPDQLAKIILKKGQTVPTGMLIEDSGETAIAGHKAVWFLHSVTDGKPVEYLLVYEVLGPVHTYQISMFGTKADYAQNRKQFEELLTSFTVIQ